MIHRDLKPANVLVTADGTVKLLDFGIAKLMPGRDVETAGLITRTGLRLMTPEYASPEQIKGEAVGSATDIYALGVVLYELLTGHLPYRLRSRIFHEIVRAICEEPPTRPSTAASQMGETDARAPGSTERISRVRRTSPTELRRRLSGDLDGIVLKALEKHPHDRYRSASSLSGDIEQHLEGRPVVARQATFVYRAGKFARRNLPWVILAVALTAALASGGIRINWIGAAVVGGCLLAMGVWYAATNREFGRRIAESKSLYPRIPGRAYLGILLSYALTPLIKTTGGFGSPFALLYLGLLAMALRQGVGWWGRRRLAGDLLLELNSSRNPPIWVMAAVTAAWVGLILERGGKYGWYGVVPLVCLGLFLSLDGRLEIRARGIVFVGTLYSWERIESYDWSIDRMDRVKRLITLSLTQASPAAKNTLRLRLRRSIQFLPPVPIQIPRGRHDEVENIMARHLSEWPNDGPTALRATFQK